MKNDSGSGCVFFTKSGSVFSQKVRFFTKNPDLVPKKNRRILPESIPALRIRDHLCKEQQFYARSRGVGKEPAHAKFQGAFSSAAWFTRLRFTFASFRTCKECNGPNVLWHWFPFRNPVLLDALARYNFPGMKINGRAPPI